MPYIGNIPAEKYAAFNVQYFTTSATATYTLDRAVANELDIRLVINNVIQEPGAGKAYTAAGTTLTLSAATAGSDTMYAVYIGKAVQTVNPGAGSVGTTALADNAVTLGKMASGTDGNIISYDASGNPVAVATGSTGQVLTSAGAGAPPTFAAASGTTINNNADNRVITGSGTANTLEGEANLTYNGTILGVGANGSSADLGVGLHIKTADSGASVNSDADQLVIEGSTGAIGMSILSATNGTGDIYFGDSGNNAAGFIQYNHSSNYMRFGTNAATEQMRITSGGILELQNGVDSGTTTCGIAIGAAQKDSKRLTVYGSAYQLSGIAEFQTSNGGGNNPLILFTDGNNSNCGEITIDAAANTVAYSTSSDYRLKENVSAISNGITRVKQLKPYRFNFITSPDNTVDGFFAHEAQEVVPEAVNGTKDAMKTVNNVVVNADGTVEIWGVTETEWTTGKTNGKYANNSTWEASKSVIDRQGIDQSKLVPLLTSALQEAITKIETLEAKVTALENA